MLSGPKNYRSATINTDALGFRQTLVGQERYDLEHIDDVPVANLILGGSTVFGVGASDDGTTIPSLLSTRSSAPWFNLGIRGGVSFQEIIHAQRFFHRPSKIDNIVIFSGLNDLYVNFVFNDHSDFDRRFEEKGQIFGYSWKRQALSEAWGKVLGVPQVDIIDLPVRHLLLLPFFWRKIPKTTQVELTPDQRWARLLDQFERNFKIYRCWQQGLSAKVIFFLQPFLYWVGRDLSDEEKAVIQYLDGIQKNTFWPVVKAALDRKFYQQVVEQLSALADKYEVSFVDSQAAFREPKQPLFVDSVHLTDLGNKVAKNLILSHLEYR